jgi:hypothetical protein
MHRPTPPPASPGRSRPPEHRWPRRRVAVHRAERPAHCGWDAGPDERSGNPSRLYCPASRHGQHDHGGTPNTPGPARELTGSPYHAADDLHVVHLLCAVVPTRRPCIRSALSRRVERCLRNHRDLGRRVAYEALKRAHLPEWARELARSPDGVQPACVVPLTAAQRNLRSCLRRSDNYLLE